MADEQVTCDRHKLHRVHEGGADWVVSRRLSDEQWPGEDERYVQHIETATKGKVLFCIGCGCGLLSTGTTQARVDAVPSEAVEETILYGALERNANLPAMHVLGLVDEFGVRAPNGEVIFAALRGGTVPLAAVEWLAEKLVAETISGFGHSSKTEEEWVAEAIQEADLAHAQAADAGQPGEERGSDE